MKALVGAFNQEKALVGITFVSSTSVQACLPQHNSVAHSTWHSVNIRNYTQPLTGPMAFLIDPVLPSYQIRQSLQVLVVAHMLICHRLPPWRHFQNKAHLWLWHHQDHIIHPKSNLATSEWWDACTLFCGKGKGPRIFFSINHYAPFWDLLG